MSNPLTLQDIINRVNPLLSNFTTGSIDQTSIISAINSSVEYLKKYITFPSDKKIQSFYFYDDNPYVDLNADFNEGLLLRYNKDTENHERNIWNYAPDIDILQKLGDYPRTKWWGWTPINGKWQAILFGKNKAKGATIATFESLSGFTAENDAENLSIDNNVVSEGSGSLAFDIDPTKGNGKGSIYFPVTLDVRNAHINGGKYKADVWLPTTALSEIDLVLGTDASNYYAFSATTQDDGSALVVNAWNTIGWKWTDNPTVVGSPDDASILFARIDLVEGGSFGSSVVTDFRLDNFLYVIPDYMDLIYLTSYKGKDKNGNLITFFTDTTDVPAFGDFSPDILDIVAYRAAVILVPQLMSNADFRKMYKDEMTEQISILGKIYPRQRAVNLGRMPLMRAR